jgi:hypothetical protein
MIEEELVTHLEAGRLETEVEIEYGYGSRSGASLLTVSTTAPFRGRARHRR